MTTRIHQIVYNCAHSDAPGSRKRRAIGVLAACPSADDPKQVIIGWSRANASAGDRFDRQRGLEIAYGRSLTGATTEVPFTMQEEYNKFLDRATRYFKDRKVII